MKKRMLFILSTVCMILLLSTSAMAADPWENPFSDVDETDWFYEAVEFTNEQGVMIGTTPTTFEPDTPATRAMLVTILWRMEEEPAPTGVSTFTDLTQDWYRNAVNWAANTDPIIVYGYNPTTFGPNDNLTREQLVTILYRYAEYNGHDISTTLSNLDAYPDGGDVSSWALDAVLWAVEDGYVEGIGGGVLDPQGTATRAMLAQIVAAYMVGNMIF